METTLPAKVAERNIGELLQKSRKGFEMALPRHLRDNVDRYMRIALTTIKRTPKLLACTGTSLVGSVMQAAQLGLEIDPVLGHAYLVPYKTTCQLIIGYKGLAHLAYRGGKVLLISARSVYENEPFNFQYGLKPNIQHSPKLTDRGKLIAVYATALLEKGVKHFDVMSVQDIEAIRKRSAAGNAGPWKTDYDEMAKKSAVRRLVKLLPLSPEAQRAIALDERAEAGLPQEIEIDAADVKVVFASSPPPAKPKAQDFGTHGTCPECAAELRENGGCTQCGYGPQAQREPGDDEPPEGLFNE